MGAWLLLESSIRHSAKIGTGWDFLASHNPTSGPE
jgi:hypothetical protein